MQYTEKSFLPTGTGIARDKWTSMSTTMPGKGIFLLYSFAAQQQLNRQGRTKLPTGINRLDCFKPFKGNQRASNTSHPGLSRKILDNGFCSSVRMYRLSSVSTHTARLLSVPRSLLWLQHSHVWLANGARAWTWRSHTQIPTTAGVSMQTHHLSTPAPAPSVSPAPDMS